MARDLKKHAERLDSRIKELDSELEKTQDKLTEVTRDKQGRLRKSALSPQGNVTSLVDRINDQILLLEQKIKDKEWLRGELINELRLTAQKIKEQNVSECMGKLDGYKAEAEKHNKEIKELHAKIQQLKSLISVNQVFLDGELIEVKPEQNVAYRTMLAESELEEAKHQTKQDILLELGIELEQERTEEVA